MLANNQLMGIIFGLQDDPDVNKILQDPQIMLYMSNGNLEELQNIPELKQFLSKPEVQQIMKFMRPQYIFSYYAFNKIWNSLVVQ